MLVFNVDRTVKFVLFILKGYCMMRDSSGNSYFLLQLECYYCKVSYISVAFEI